MNDDDVARRISGAERVRDGILPPRSTGNDAQRFSGAAQIRRRIVGERLRQRDDDLIHGRVSEERGDAPLENRASTNFQELLRRPATKAQAAPSGGDDGGHEHGWLEEFCNVSTAFATTACTRAASARASRTVGVSIAGG